MSYTIRTSEGELDAGFYAAFTDYVRLGDYSFKTDDLCDIVKKLAENKDLKETQLDNYGQDAFWGKENEFIDSIVGSNFSATEIEPLDKIPVKVSDDENYVKIGDYDIISKEFNAFATYVASGGWSGILKKTHNPIINSIENSERKLYD